MKQNFVVNGSIYEDTPGVPVDIAKVLNIQVPGKNQAPTDFKFNVRSPSGDSVTQLVPSDLLVVLQEIADMHGSPGMSLVLSFLNALKGVSQVAPGQTIEIDTQVCSGRITSHIALSSLMPALMALLNSGIHEEVQPVRNTCCVEHCRLWKPPNSRYVQRRSRHAGSREYTFWHLFYLLSGTACQ